MIYITVDLNRDIYIKIPKVKEGVSPYTLSMTSQAGGQQVVFTDLVDNSDKSSVYRFILNFTQYTPSGIYNYTLEDSTDKQMSKGLVQLNMNNPEDVFYQEDEPSYFVDESEPVDMSNFYTKSEVDLKLTDYYTKSEVDTIIENLPDNSNCVKYSDLNDYGYISASDLNSMSYMTKYEVNSMGYVTQQNLSNMGYIRMFEAVPVIGAEVTRQIDEKHIITEEDLDQSVASYIQTKIEEGDLVTRTEVNNVVEEEVTYQLSNIDFVTEQNMEEYVESYINSKDLVNSTQLANTLEWYVTDAELQNAGYITTENVRHNYYNKPETEANFTSYAYLEERLAGFTPTPDLSAYVTKTDLSNQSYVKSADLPNFNTFVLKNELSAQSYIKSSDLNNYVSKTELENCAYVTKNALEGNYYSKTDINSMGYVTSSALTDYATKSYVQEKINEIPGVDMSSYVTKSDLANQSYVTSSVLTNYATKSYVQEKINEIPGVDLTGYVKKSELSAQSYITPSVLSAKSYVTATQLSNCGYVTTSQLPSVSNAGIVLKQGGVTKGTFTLNQSTGATIDFDATSSDITMDDVKQYVVSQSYVTSTALSNQSYVTKSQLSAQSYAKTSQLPDMSQYYTKQDIVNIGYVQSTALSNDYYNKNDIDSLLYTSYVTKTELSNQSYITSAALGDYVTKQQLNTAAYINSTQANTIAYNKSKQVINELNTETLVFTLIDDSQVYVTCYTKINNE